MTDDELFGNTPVPAAPVVAAAPAASAAAPAQATGPAGLAINNPTNLRPIPGGWKGQTGVSPGGFAIFDNLGDGWGAADQNLLAKFTKHGAKSLNDVIGNPTYGWAPTGDGANDPASYVAKVAPDIGVEPTDDISARGISDPAFRHQILQTMASNVEIGKPVVYGAGLADTGTLSPADQAKWNDLYGDQVPPIQGPGGKTKALPTNPQADTAEYLTLHGFRDPDATPASSTNPAAELADGTIPTNPGDWYIAKAGQLRQVGSDVPDYLPGYKTVAANRATAASQPVVNRLLTGAGQGIADVAGSVNKLTGGGLAVGDPMLAAYGQTQGGSSIPATAQASLEGFDQERNAYNLLRHGDAVAAAGRFGSQLAATAPALALGGEALGAAGPAGEFLAGSSVGNPLLTVASRAAGGALQGAGASALTSETSDRPILTQMGGGAVSGGLAGPLVPAAGNMLLGGVKGAIGADAVSPAVRDLADKAINQYGIPLRGSQIAGVGDRATAIRDSNLLSEPGSGFAANNEAQHAAFTKAIGDTFGGGSNGGPVTALTPDVMQGAKTRIGGVFNRVGQNTTITDTDPLLTNLGQIAHDAGQVLPDTEVKPILNQIQNIGSTIQDDGSLSGDSYLALTRKGSALDTAQNSANPGIRLYAGQVRDALDDALERHASPEDLADLQNARYQYKNLMTIKGLAAKAGVEGTISPALLNGAVNTSFKNRAFSGAGDLGDLAQIGQTFMKEPANSNTPARLLDMARRNTIPALIGGGALGELSFLHDPGLALKIGAGALLAKGAGMAGTAFSGLRNGPVGANLLLRGAQEPGPIGNALLSGLNLGKGFVLPAYAPAAALGYNPLLAAPSTQ